MSAMQGRTQCAPATIFMTKDVRMYRDFLDFSDLTREEWEELYSLASDMAARPGDYYGACAGKILATLFYEPSTRTQFSIQSAMMRLGGSALGFAGPAATSVEKGESLADTVRMISGYSDILTIRHPIEGAAFAASLYSSVPVINSGDGSHLHPTQAITDLFAIGKLLGRYEGLTIGLCGDLLNGRTVHSLVKAFCKFTGNTFYLISTPELALPERYAAPLRAAGNKTLACARLEDALPKLDLLYMTRIQKERFRSADEYERQVGIYVLDAEKLRLARENTLILHPLPRIDEIAPEVDCDPRAKYFEQARGGVFIRMALIVKLLAAVGAPLPAAFEPSPGLSCANPLCVTKHEKYLPPLFDGAGICRYCENVAESSF